MPTRFGAGRFPVRPLERVLAPQLQPMLLLETWWKRAVRNGFRERFALALDRLLEARMTALMPTERHRSTMSARLTT